MVCNSYETAFFELEELKKEKMQVCTLPCFQTKTSLFSADSYCLLGDPCRVGDAPSYETQLILKRIIFGTSLKESKL